MPVMESKSSRSSNHSFEPPLSPSHLRQQPRRKPKKGQSQQAFEGNGRVQGQSQDQPHPPYPLFNNRSLSMISTMHHLNPHRKVAMSPEVLREAEEQATSLKNLVKQLQEQLDKANREKQRMHRFLSDLLYTLNARGYESVQDHEGTVVDLNKCKGETYLDLRGRDLKQRVNVRRQSGQEFLLKAVIGNQERAIQSLVYRIDAIGRDILLGNRLFNINENEGGAAAGNEGTKVASLEAEVLQLISLIEGACNRCPEVYSALRDYYYLTEDGADLSMSSPRNPVIQNLLKKCEQISGEAQSRQLVDLLSTNNGNKLRPKSRAGKTASPGNNLTPKPVKSKTQTEAKPKQSTSKSSRSSSSSSDTGAGAMGQCNITELFGNLPPPPRSAENRFEDHLRPLNGSKSDNSFKKATIRPRSMQQSSSMSQPNSGGEPMPSVFLNGKYGIDQALINDHSVSHCPYCHRKFGMEESIGDIKNHIEMHIFAGDAIV